MVVVESDTDLTHAVSTVSAACRFANLLHGWQQHANQNADDRNHDQQLDQGKTLAILCGHRNSPYTDKNSG
jgi:hypothetical protein